MILTSTDAAIYELLEIELGERAARDMFLENRYGMVAQ